MKRYRLLMVAVFAVLALGVASASAQILVPMTMTNDTTVRQLAFGIKVGAGDCIDTSNQIAPYQEVELPPLPPSGVFDTRFVDPVAVAFPYNTTCFGEGSAVDIRSSIIVGAQTDTFRVIWQPGDVSSVTLTWPAGLGSVATSMTLVDEVSGGLFINVDMLAATSLNITNPAANTLRIIATWIVTPPSGTQFRSLTPAQVFDEDPAKPGKSKKIIKRFKGLGMPNFGNLLSELTAQGGFRPKPLGISDTAGGLVVGWPSMFLKNPAKFQWAPIKDSANIRFWVRLTKWDGVKNIGKSYNAIQKTLRSKTFVHTTGLPRGFDSTGVPGDIKRKPLKKQATKLDPKKTPNRLFEEMVALNVNIAASAIGKIPEGFGDLIFDQNGHPYDELSLIQIRDRVNRIMTYWGEANPNEFQDAYTAVNLANLAFTAPFDTVAWETGGDTAKLVLTGPVNIAFVPYLKLPAGPFVPTRITPANNLAEAPDDFDTAEDDVFEETTPNAVKLFQNYPNPFNPTTTLAFRLAGDALVNITVYDMLGREVGTLLQGEELEAGVNTIDFDAASLASGVYFYRITGEQLETGAQLAPVTGKMMLLK